MTGLSTILKGISGENEIVRTLGAGGILAYIAGAVGFVSWDMARGAHFDLVAWCAAFPTGLGLAIGAVAGAVAVKDRNVAAAKQTQAATDSVSGAVAGDAG